MYTEVLPISEQILGPSPLELSPPAATLPDGGPASADTQPERGTCARLCRPFASVCSAPVTQAAGRHAASPAAGHRQGARTERSQQARGHRVKR